jgi:hypothetical protein
MTKQQLFDTVATHLLTQRRRSTRKSFCAYRGRDGLRCAIGCLIPDERYTPNLEGKSAEQADVRRAAGLRRGQGTLATDLQNLHDTLPVNQWHTKLYDIAHNHGLSVRVLLKQE